MTNKERDKETKNYLTKRKTIRQTENYYQTNKKLLDKHKHTTDNQKNTFRQTDKILSDKQKNILTINQTNVQAEIYY